MWVWDASHPGDCDHDRATTMTRDANGNVVTKSVKAETISGSKVWGVTVWFGSVYVTTVRRYYYETRRQAQDGDISDDIGRRGRVA